MIDRIQSAGPRMIGRMLAASAAVATLALAAPDAGAQQQHGRPPPRSSVRRRVRLNRQSRRSPLRRPSRRRHSPSNSSRPSSRSSSFRRG